LNQIAGISYEETALAQHGYITFTLSWNIEKSKSLLLGLLDENTIVFEKSKMDVLEM
jgi:hypothetical protein